MIVQRNTIRGTWSDGGPYVEVECRVKGPAIIRLISGHYGDNRELVFEEKPNHTSGASGQTEKAKPVGAKPQISSTGLVGYQDYDCIQSEKDSGRVFIINHSGVLLACMSRHQFEDATTPQRAEGVGTPTVLLDRTKVHRQKDVQILHLLDQKPTVPFMDFSADYHLEQDEDLWIKGNPQEGRPSGTFGRLLKRGLKDGVYSPREGARELFLELDVGANVRGASGSPIVQVSTGKPVGVLLAANDADAAFYITFEPICLLGSTLPPPLPESQIEVRAADLVGNWTEDFGAKGKTTNTFNADGSYTGSYQPKSARSPTTFRGQWRIEGQTLVNEMTECSHPEYLKERAVNRQKVIEITGDSLIYQSQPGPILVMRRSATY